MSKNLSSGMGIIGDVVATLVFGLGLFGLGWLFISAWTWIFGIDPNSESWYAYLGHWASILFICSPLVSGLVDGLAKGLATLASKLVSDYNRVFVMCIIVAIIVYAVYIVMMVFAVKEYNVSHEERHGFHLTMQIIYAIIFLLISISSAWGVASTKKNEEKPVDNGTENK